MVYFNCRTDPVRLTEHLRGACKSEHTKKRNTVPKPRSCLDQAWFFRKYYIRRGGGAGRVPQRGRLIKLDFPSAKAEDFVWGMGGSQSQKDPPLSYKQSPAPDMKRGVSFAGLVRGNDALARATRGGVAANFGCPRLERLCGPESFGTRGRGGGGGCGGSLRGPCRRLHADALAPLGVEHLLCRFCALPRSLLYWGANAAVGGRPNSYDVPTGP